MKKKPGASTPLTKEKTFYAPKIPRRMIRETPKIMNVMKNLNTRFTGNYTRFIMH
jgi:hypothetical protein